MSMPKALGNKFASFTGSSGLFFFALYLRVHYVLTATILNLGQDAAQYYSYAWNVAHYGIFSLALPGSEKIIPDSYRDPGFPTLLSAWLLLGDKDRWWYAGILFTQAFLSAVTVVLIFKLARRWLPSACAFGVGIAAALWPHSITSCDYLLTETLFGFLCTAALLCFSQSTASRSPTLVAASAGVLFGLATMTNSVLLFFPLTLIALASLRRWLSAKSLAAFCLAFAILPTLWMFRGTSLPASGDSSRGRVMINLVQGSYPGFLDAYQDSQGGLSESSLALRSEVTDAQNLALRAPDAAMRDLLDRISSQPAHYLKWYLLDKPAMLWGWSIRAGMGDVYVYPTTDSPYESSLPWRISIAIARGLNPVLGILMLALVAVILVNLLGRKRSGLPKTAEIVCLSCVSLVIYITLIYSVLQAEPRYSTAFRGIEINLAVGGLWLLFKWMKKVSPARLEQGAE